MYLHQAHIGNILKSKFIGYKDFDTLMYTCAAEFDFMEKEVIQSAYHGGENLLVSS